MRKVIVFEEVLISPDYLSILVREFQGPEPSYRFNIISSAHPVPCPGRNTYYRIPKVGSDNPDHNTGCSERNPFSFAVRMEAQANQPQREGKAWQ